MNIKIKNIIFGTGVSSSKDEKGLLSVCWEAMKSGITKFDTAPSYKTEEVLSKVLRKCAADLGMRRENYYIQTKIDPIQMYNGKIEEYFREKLAIMQLDYVDALLVHWPVKNYFKRTWTEMQKLKAVGLTKEIGICNLRYTQMCELEKEGIIPAIIQIERHPLNTFEREVAFCQRHNIWLQDYSPLCKMHTKIRECDNVKKIAKTHNRDIGQIILRWHLDTGATPIFTSTKTQRVGLYSNIFDFHLSKEEIEDISGLNCNHKLYLESLVCPGY